LEHPGEDIPDGRAVGGSDGVQRVAARELAISSGATIETKSGEFGLGEISDGATAVGILLALGVLVMTVGLVRSEAARDLRTLTAVEASSGIRRTIVGATAAGVTTSRQELRARPVEPPDNYSPSVFSSQCQIPPTLDAAPLIRSNFSATSGEAPGASDA
jgi:hypothetical protein